MRPKPPSLTPVPGQPMAYRLGLGEVYFGPKEAHIHTLLGSCVSVVLQHEDNMGVCHFVNAGEPKVQSLKPYWFSGPALRHMLAAFRAIGVLPHALKAELYGGGTPNQAAGQMSSVGEANVQAAREWLSAHHIALVKQDVGGAVSRRLTVHLGKGQCVSTPVQSRVA